MTLFRSFWLILLRFSSGAMVAAGIFAFIAVIGVVPRLAQKTKTESACRFYESCITAGGIFGCLPLVFDFVLPIPQVLFVPVGFCVGIFIGTLAVSLAEVLNVVPVFLRRARLTIGIPVFLLAVALGKLAGALLSFLVSYFA